MSAACAIFPMMSQVNFEHLMQSSDDHLENEVCVSSAAGRRWLAIGNRRLSGASGSRESGSERIRLQSIWILRDITATKQAEQEREAARSAMALAEVSTILAHEIRNPLASMELFAGLIAEDSGNTAQWVSNLRAGIRLLSGTVNNVLSIHCGITPHLTPVDLTACVRDGVEFVQPIAEQAGVALSFQAIDEDLMIQGNENGLRQIILNLICNAIRHTPAGGDITVSTQGTLRGDETLALVEVTDTGCGIPEHADRPDIRGGIQCGRSYSWAGPCGLQAADDATRRRDTRYQPCQLRKHFSIGVSSPMTFDSASSVLVVDDEPGIRTALRANFLRHGWRVETASSVREAIRNFEGKEFDLVVTDMRMPDGTGMEVMRSARQLSPGTAVILLTAYGSVPDAVTAMRDGALDYLTKPISFDQLQATAAQVMRRAKQMPVGRGCAGRRHRWPLAAVASRDPTGARGGKHGRRCSDRGGERDRQGTAGALHSRFERPLPQAVCRGELRGGPGGAAGERAVWPWREAHSPARSRRSRASSSWRMAERFCWTRSARCRCTCNRSCCALCRSASLNGLAKRGRSMSTFG